MTPKQNDKLVSFQPHQILDLIKAAFAQFTNPVRQICVKVGRQRNISYKY